MTADTLPPLATLLRDELVVDDARLGRMLRMTACATLLATLFLVFRVPLPAYGAYIALMASQRDVSTSLVTAVGAFAAGVVAIGASLLLYIVDIDEPALRIPMMAFAMFLAMYGARLPRIGPVVFLAGFLLVVTQTLIDQIPDAEALTHLLLWLLLLLASACTLVPLVEAAFGRSARTVFEQGIGEREHPTASVGELGSLAHRLGGDAMGRLADTLRLEQVETLQRRLASGGTDQRRLMAIVAAARHGTQRSPVDCAAPLSADPPARSTTLAVRFALKATLAAMACYVTYSALDWSGIRTAIITCFFVALASTGETIHKLSLRLTGALIGGLLAGISIVFLFPVMDDIGSFIVLFAVVTLGCAWVATSSPLLAYAGLQIAFAFFLGVLQDTGPTDDLTVLRDRLAGIILGNIAMSLVFAVLWPVSTAANVRAIMSRVLARQARLTAQNLPPAPVDIVAGATDLEDLHRLTTLGAFDIGTPPVAVAVQREHVAALERVVAWMSALEAEGMPSATGAWLARRLHHLSSAEQDIFRPLPTDDLPVDLLHALDTLDARTPHAP